jgi:tetratricopeptide (TPR) repeat protein
VRLQPTNPFWRLRLARAHRKQGDAKQAIAAESEAKLLISNGYGKGTLIGDYFARDGRYKEAADEYMVAHRKNPDDSGIAVQAAILLLITEYRSGYEALCQDLLNQANTTNDRNIIRRVCWACLIANPPFGRPDVLLRLSEKAVHIMEDSLTCRECGLAAYRISDFTGALKWCEKSRRLSEREDYRAQNLFVEAMALHQLGRPQDARLSFDEAVNATRRAFPDFYYGVPRQEAFGEGLPDWIDYVDCELRRREAEALLKSRTSNSANITTIGPTENETQNASQVTDD